PTTGVGSRLPRRGKRGRKTARQCRAAERSNVIMAYLRLKGRGRPGESPGRPADIPISGSSRSGRPAPRAPPAVPPGAAAHGAAGAAAQGAAEQAGQRRPQRRVKEFGGQRRPGLTDQAQDGMDRHSSSSVLEKQETENGGWQGQPPPRTGSVADDHAPSERRPL